MVAVQNECLIGFGDVDMLSRYLDRLFVNKDCQRVGVASTIYFGLEFSVKTEKIFTYASVTAVPFFLKMGFVIVKRQ